MKKKIMALLFGGAMAFSLFAASGNPVQAAEDPDCECHNVTPIFGAEKNKIIANVISSQEFKDMKLAVIKDGDTWRGVKGTEVMVNNYYGFTIVGIPYLSQDGTAMMAVFIDGKYMGSSPKDS
ncbi:hypothetical protein [Bacillus sp. FJAT-29814]|uniref:hypothetical protein n=1 Tax=Bacillus sp. FJAT-29814 TaxID=1729688 RepID=UPI000834F2A5|nr:hypothetical protein [Bacillus sp. FJAT-29814]